MTKFNVVFATDEGYVEHLSVALISLLANNKDGDFIIYIINEGIGENNFKKLESVTTKFNCHLVNLTIDDTLFSNLVINHHFTKANYYRLLIPNLLDVDKVLYMDADIVVNGPIDELYEEDIDEYLIAAVENPGFNSHADLKMKEHSRYFNSGIMLMNLKRWRDFNVTEKVIDFVDKNPSVIKFVDQCGLNAVVDGNWKPLHLKFNQQAVIYEKNFAEECFCFSDAELIMAKENPIIIHYTGSSKPWHLRNKHPLKHLYWFYLKKTPYKFKLPSDLTIFNFIKWLLPKFIFDFMQKLKTHNN